MSKEFCGNREVCEKSCRLFELLGAVGIDPDVAFEAARQAAHLPHAQCVDGRHTSKPDRQGNWFVYCGQPPEVQTGVQAIALAAGMQQGLAGTQLRDIMRS